MPAGFLLAVVVALDISGGVCWQESAKCNILRLGCGGSLSGVWAKPLVSSNSENAPASLLHW